MSPAGRKLAQHAAATVANGVGKVGAKRIGTTSAARKQRDLAHTLARQVHGELSKAVFIDSTDEHWVVWKEGVPMAAFPALEGDLAARPELAHVSDADRFEPPPTTVQTGQRGLRDRLPIVLRRNQIEKDDKQEPPQ